MIGKKIAAVCGLCVLNLTAGPSRVLAASPEFAYTAEKWASLRDNKLEFDEIGDLVHEYNNTVIQNQIDYKDYRGESQDDIAGDYYDAADDIYGSLEYPDSDSADYASRLSSYLSSQIQANKLREQGDDNLEDGEIKKLGYDQTEAGLVKQAQQQMINFWSQSYSLKNLEEARNQAVDAYNSSLTRQAAGLSTQAETLSAQEAVTSAEASILSAESSLDKTRESLCLMLGWSYGSQVEIGEAPEAGTEISSVDLEADVAKGVENNYSLKILQKKLSMAQSVSSRQSLEETYKTQRETVSSNIKNAYQSLVLAQSDYAQAMESCALEKNSMDTAQRKMAAGTMTKNDYQKQVSSYSTVQTKAYTAKLALLQAGLDYQWAVDGLADAS